MNYPRVCVESNTRSACNLHNVTVAATSINNNLVSVKHQSRESKLHTHTHTLAQHCKSLFSCVYIQNECYLCKLSGKAAPKLPLSLDAVRPYHYIMCVHVINRAKGWIYYCHFFFIFYTYYINRAVTASKAEGVKDRGDPKSRASAPLVSRLIIYVHTRTLRRQGPAIYTTHHTTYKRECCVCEWVNARVCVCCINRWSENRKTFNGAQTIAVCRRARGTYAERL